MKFTKLLPILGTITLASSSPLVSNCGVSVASVILEQTVIDQNVTLKSFSLEKGKESTIELILPSDTEISFITITIGGTTINASDVTISGGTILIPADKMTSNKIVIKSIGLLDTSTDAETWYDYIFNRTFSLLGTSDAETSRYLSWGTAWILSDATPDDTTDYVYNIVTNWHVMKEIEDTHEIGTNDKILFGCNTKPSGLSIENLQDFIQFASFNKKADVNFSYDGTSTITTTQYVEEEARDGKYITKTGLRGCDIFVAIADFSSLISSPSPSASIAKTKLDKLNKITASGKKITELADTASDAKHFEDKKLYSGGYPVKNSCYATWEKHDLTIENVALKYTSGTRLGKEVVSHWSDNHVNPLIDCSPQYYSKKDLGTSWMIGGASGSMLVGNFGTDSKPIWKICGIYWGGPGSATSFYPFYSIFNSDWKNYAKQWI